MEKSLDGAEIPEAIEGYFEDGSFVETVKDSLASYKTFLDDSLGIASDPTQTRRFQHGQNMNDIEHGQLILPPIGVLKIKDHVEPPKPTEDVPKIEGILKIKDHVEPPKPNKEKEELINILQTKAGALEKEGGNDTGMNYRQNFSPATSV